uniref:Four and a half LIM domains protein 2 n=1 Tax=Macrostomum lignano TaxID=282301 RepID=A0A1I8ICL7_9PLAT
MSEAVHASLPHQVACSLCGRQLAGCRYVVTEDAAACTDCFESRLANECAKCGARIGCEMTDLGHGGRHWHEACFRCSACGCSLASQPFLAKEGDVYCTSCHDERFAARCCRCYQVFKAGSRKLEWRSQQYHEQCFLCSECGCGIGCDSFIPHGDNACCVPCYEGRFAQRCRECRQVIRKGGVTYKGQAFHSDCLVCGHCAKPLAGLKFTSQQERPYCADCFGQLFARKCCRCCQPITGFTGAKFVSFEDRDWHSDCFTCSRCSDSLVGRGFLTEGDALLCTGCASLPK